MSSSSSTQKQKLLNKKRKCYNALEEYEINSKSERETNDMRSNKNKNINTINKSRIRGEKKDTSSETLNIADDSDESEKQEKKIKYKKSNESKNVKKKVNPKKSKKIERATKQSSSSNGESESISKSSSSNKIKSKANEDNNNNNIKKKILVKNIDCHSEKDIKKIVEFENDENVKNTNKKEGMIVSGKHISIKENLNTDSNCIYNKFNELRNFIMDSESRLNDKLKKTNDELNKTKDELHKLKKNTNIKIGLLSQIIKQSNIYNKNNNKLLESKIDFLKNILLVMYKRKLTNLITLDIINANKNDLAITKHKFGVDKKFGIIVAKKDINGISKYKINLLLDFLRHIKQLSSKVIHMKKVKQFKLKNEIFSEFLKEYKFHKKSEDENGLLQTKDIINFIFGEERQEKRSNRIKKFFSIRI